MKKGQRLEACRRGHPFDEENTRIRRSGRGGYERICRECTRQRQMVRYWRMKYGEEAERRWVPA